MRADGAHPERGTFVRDQVAALRALGGVDVELAEFAPGRPALVRATADLRRRYGGRGGGRARGDSGATAGFDVVHAHYGLTAWPALAVPARVRALTVHGTDVRHPRTRLLTRAVLGRVDLLAAASGELAAALPTQAARDRCLVLPCGVDLERFALIPRAQARTELGLAVDGRYVLFPADPSRAGKRHDRAAALAQAAGARLLALGGIDPLRVPLWVNAADAVLVPSEQEGFGLAAVEALACDVAVLATPVGIHREALDGIDGCLCAPFDAAAWGRALEALLARPDPRVRGRDRAREYSSTAMAKRVLGAWEQALERFG